MEGKKRRLTPAAGFSLPVKIIASLFAIGVIVTAAPAHNSIHITADSSGFPAFCRLEVTLYDGDRPLQEIANPRIVENSAEGKFAMTFSSLTSPVLSDQPLQVHSGSLPLHFTLEPQQSEALTIYGRSIPFSGISSYYDFGKGCYCFQLFFKKRAYRDRAHPALYSTYSHPSGGLNPARPVAVKRSRASTIFMKSVKTAFLMVLIAVVLLVSTGYTLKLYFNKDLFETFFFERLHRYLESDNKFDQLLRKFAELKQIPKRCRQFLAAKGISGKEQKQSRLQKLMTSKELTQEEAELYIHTFRGKLDGLLSLRK